VKNRSNRCKKQFGHDGLLESPATACVISCARMVKSLRALLLLGTLLASPAAGLAVMILPAPDCCSGAMCPMHRSEKLQCEKMPCQDGSSLPQTCACAPGHQAQVSLQRLAPQAILTPHPVLFRPVLAPNGPASGTRTLAIRPIWPPDQPPRL
jgi:hypothetical protein